MADHTSSNHQQKSVKAGNGTDAGRQAELQQSAWDVIPKLKDHSIRDLSPRDIMRLQATIGNQAVVQMMRDTVPQEDATDCGCQRTPDDTIQRAEIPSELQTSVDHASMSEAELEYRLGLINQTLSEFNESTPDTALLYEEKNTIVSELEQRSQTSVDPDMDPAPGMSMPEESGGDAAGGQQELEVPVMFEAYEITPGMGGPGGEADNGAGDDGMGMGYGGFGTSLAMAGNSLAYGDMSWMTPEQAARFSMSADYYRPMLPDMDRVILDRVVDELPRDLATRSTTEPVWKNSASGKPFGFPHPTEPFEQIPFTKEQVDSIPDLVRRLNAEDSLTVAERELLKRAADLHIGAANPGSPLVSYAQPDAPAVFQKQWRVRVSMNPDAVLDVSSENTRAFKVLDGLENIEEFELLVTEDGKGRILSVEKGAAVDSTPGFMMRHANKIRWAGRAVFVVGLGVSAYRIGTAEPEKQARVAGEEAGSQLGGAAGTALAVGGCLAFGIATSGLGLFLCGLGGGLIGGMAGSAVGGEMVDSMEDSGSDEPCPSCHAMQREWEQNQNMMIPHMEQWYSMGEGANDEGRLDTIRNTPLTEAEVAVIREWIEGLDAGGEAEPQ